MKLIFSVLLIVFISCSSPQSPNWETISPGIAVKHTSNPYGNHIVLSFAGWSVKQEWTQIWVDELKDKSLFEKGFATYFAIKGPNQVLFDSLEIDTSFLADYLSNLLLTYNKYGSYPKVTVIAHSSGAFVAHHFLQNFYSDSVNQTRFKELITYYNLDGDVGSSTVGTTLINEIAKNLSKIYAVSAIQDSSQLKSANYDAMIQLEKTYPNKAEFVEIKATNSNCSGKWCLHDALINQTPYNPTTFDLEQDYTKFDADHPITTAYLQ